MRWKVLAFVFTQTLAGAFSAFAQEAAERQPKVEIAIVPGGATHFHQGDDTGEPSFTNYDVAASLTFNLNRYIAVEGEVNSALGRSQNLNFATSTASDVTTPNLLGYTGNVVVSMPSGRSVAPFITAGAGGLSVFDRDEVFQNTRTFLAGNVGGGVKWYGGHWGLRADYRFLAVRSHDVDAGSAVRPRGDFFGKETRYGHRVYGGVILNID